MTDPCRTEVEELHRFFTDWFHGRLPLEAFSRVEHALSPTFVLVSPSGTRSEQASLLNEIRDAHGGRAGSDFHIWTKAVTSRSLGNDLLLCEYEEWQRSNGEERGRRSTALFRRDKGAPGGLLWEHVHETWSTG